MPGDARDRPQSDARPCMAARSGVSAPILSAGITERRSLSWGVAERVRPSYEMRMNKTGVHMPLYEHVFIARQDLSNAQAEGLIEHFSTVLSDNGGKVVENEYWGVKTMAYKINKNRKGHYAFLKTDAPAQAVQEMERLMRLHDDVMRVMTIKVDAHEDGPSVQMQKKDERGERRERR
jgi:small subunit ribosomal protein S6